eukprot:RCo036273
MGQAKSTAVSSLKDRQCDFLVGVDPLTLLGILRAGAADPRVFWAHLCCDVEGFVRTSFVITVESICALFFLLAWHFHRPGLLSPSLCTTQCTTQLTFSFVLHPMGTRARRSGVPADAFTCTSSARRLFWFQLFDPLPPILFFLF